MKSHNVAASLNFLELSRNNVLRYAPTYLEFRQFGKLEKIEIPKDGRSVRNMGVELVVKDGNTIMFTKMEPNVLCVASDELNETIFSVGDSNHHCAALLKFNRNYTFQHDIFDMFTKQGNVRFYRIFDAVYAPSDIFREFDGFDFLLDKSGKMTIVSYEKKITIDVLVQTDVGNSLFLSIDFDCKTKNKLRFQTLDSRSFTAETDESLEFMHSGSLRSSISESNFNAFNRPGKVDFELTGDENNISNLLAISSSDIASFISLPMRPEITKSITVKTPTWPIFFDLRSLIGQEFVSCSALPHGVKISEGSSLIVESDDWRDDSETIDLCTKEGEIVPFTIKYEKYSFEPKRTLYYGSPEGPLRLSFEAMYSTPSARISDPDQICKIEERTIIIPKNVLCGGSHNFLINESQIINIDFKTHVAKTKRELSFYLTPGPNTLYVSENILYFKMENDFYSPKTTINIDKSTLSIRDSTVFFDLDEFNTNQLPPVFVQTENEELEIKLKCLPRSAPCHLHWLAGQNIKYPLSSSEFNPSDLKRTLFITVDGERSKNSKVLENDDLTLSVNENGMLEGTVKRCFNGPGFKESIFIHYVEEDGIIRSVVPFTITFEKFPKIPKNIHYFDLVDFENSIDFEVDFYVVRNRSYSANSCAFVAGGILKISSSGSYTYWRNVALVTIDITCYGPSGEATNVVISSSKIHAGPFYVDAEKENETFFKIDLPPQISVIKYRDFLMPRLTSDASTMLMLGRNKFMCNPMGEGMIYSTGDQFPLLYLTLSDGSQNTRSCPIYVRIGNLLDLKPTHAGKFEVDPGFSVVSFGIENDQISVGEIYQTCGLKLTVKKTGEFSALCTLSESPKIRYKISDCDSSFEKSCRIFGDATPTPVCDELDFNLPVQDFDLPDSPHEQDSEKKEQEDLPRNLSFPKLSDEQEFSLAGPPEKQTFVMYPTGTIFHRTVKIPSDLVSTKNIDEWTVSFPTGNHRNDYELTTCNLRHPTIFNIAGVGGAMLKIPSFESCLYLSHSEYYEQVENLNELVIRVKKTLDRDVEIQVHIIVSDTDLTYCHTCTFKFLKMNNFPRDFKIGTSGFLKVGDNFTLLDGTDLVCTRGNLSFKTDKAERATGRARFLWKYCVLELEIRVERSASVISSALRTAGEMISVCNLNRAVLNYSEEYVKIEKNVIATVEKIPEELVPKKPVASRSTRIFSATNSNVTVNLIPAATKTLRNYNFVMSLQKKTAIVETFVNVKINSSDLIAASDVTAILTCVNGFVFIKPGSYKVSDLGTVKIYNVSVHSSFNFPSGTNIKASEFKGIKEPILAFAFGETAPLMVPNSDALDAGASVYYLGNVYYLN